MILVGDEHNLYNREEALNRVNTWISNCDAKISFSLAFAGVLLGVFFTSDTIQTSLFKVLKNVMDLGKNEFILLATTLIFAGFVICLILSIWYFFRGLRGTINSSVYKQDSIATRSLLFFGSIQNYNFNEFRDKVESVKKEELVNDYLSQIHINSIICQRKFINYNKGIKFLLLSIIFFVLLNIGFLFV